MPPLHYQAALRSIHYRVGGSGFTYPKGGKYMNLQQRITIEPGKRGGKPCIRGLRITVYDVLEMLAQGMSHAEILEDFPELEAEDISSCLFFAANREHNLFTLTIA
ncbi:MAG: DUF433 domain-containing protein [Burkholderiales bacterium]